MANLMLYQDPTGIQAGSLNLMSVSLYWRFMGDLLFILLAGLDRDPPDICKYKCGCNAVAYLSLTITGSPTVKQPTRQRWYAKHQAQTFASWISLQLLANDSIGTLFGVCGWPGRHR